MINKNLQQSDIPWRHYYTDSMFKDLDTIYDVYKQLVPLHEEIASNPIEYNLKRKKDTITDNYHSCEIDINVSLANEHKVLKDLVTYFSNTGRKYLEKIGNIDLAGHFLRVQLIRDINGYEIVPHTDTENKRATILCHMTNLKDKGTQLMNNRMEIIKRSPSYKNNALVFFPNYSNFIKTYHGFIDTAIDDYRDVLMINYFKTDDVVTENGLWKIPL